MSEATIPARLPACHCSSPSARSRIIRVYIYIYISLLPPSLSTLTTLPPLNPRFRDPRRVLSVASISYERYPTIGGKDGCTVAKGAVRFDEIRVYARDYGRRNKIVATVESRCERRRQLLDHPRTRASSAHMLVGIPLDIYRL